MAYRILVASLLALLMMSACSTSASDGTTPEQPASEAAPAEQDATDESTDTEIVEEDTSANVDTQVAAVPGAPLLVVLADAVKLTEYAGAKITHDDRQTTYATEMTFDDALVSITSTYAEAGYIDSGVYNDTDDKGFYARRAYSKAKGEAGDFEGSCEVLVRKASSPEWEKGLGTDKVVVGILCFKNF